jgi:hypothetical protein
VERGTGEEKVLDGNRTRPEIPFRNGGVGIGDCANRLRLELGFRKAGDGRENDASREGAQRSPDAPLRWHL